MIELRIQGPYSFLPFSKHTQSLYTAENIWKPGVYFWTYHFDGAFKLNYVGISNSSVAQRQADHLASFLAGKFDIYDFELLSNGEIHRAYSNGFGHNKFTENQFNLELQLNRLCFFFAPIEDIESTILKRIETAIILQIRDCPNHAKIFDNGHPSRNRREDEIEIPVIVKSGKTIEGLSDSFVA